MTKKQEKQFSKVKSRPDFYDIQQKVLNFWKKNKVFEKSIEQRSEKEPYTFYDGPPFVTGYPHYGHLIGSIAKDVIPRYYTMKGKRVRRVWGWDCHGLPIENKVEEKLGLKNRQDIEEYGIDKFINECRSYVENISREWEWYIDNIGRWVDMENAYRTMDLDYMESVIWVFKQLYDKNLIYKGVRTSLYCTRCGTPISNFEIAMDNSYVEMQDPAITVKFKLKKPPKNLAAEEPVYMLAWTTTPWTLPSNRALVIAPEKLYLVVSIENKQGSYVLAKERAEYVLDGLDYQVLDKIQGKEFLGLEYQPPFDFFPPNKNDLKVYEYEDMVNMDEGTGIVHSAPGFGDIDTEMGRDLDLTIMLAVDKEGNFVSEVKNWAGIYVKDADPQIIENLKQRNLLFKKETITHRYPYCYRCETPLIHRAQESWFVNVQSLKDRLLETNKEINWVPEHFKRGRFKEGVEQAPDWCISRTRYWATVMPIWQCDKCGELKVLGSIEEIEKYTDKKVTDLHRSGVDEIVFECEKCQGNMIRIPEVLDCWIESGSMPYAERHYPFENKEQFENAFPADYITEYTGQVRAWFYVMHVISNALMDSHCFKNVVVTGVMTGTDGRKMSKSYGNYPDPEKTIKKYGADALRLYFLSSPIMLGQKAQMTKGQELEDEVRRVLLILWNSYRYFLTYLHKNNIEPKDIKTLESLNLSELNVIDRWMLAYFTNFHQEFEKSLRNYRIPDAVRLIQPFINQLSTWYIRRSRNRFVAGEKEPFIVFYYVLKNFIKIIAPVVPFTSEAIYRNIKFANEPESVHLSFYPEVNSEYLDNDLITRMDLVQKIVKEGHSQRKKEQLKVRQPLTKATLFLPDRGFLNDELKNLIKKELNVKNIELEKSEELKVILDTKLTPELKNEGKAREVIRQIQRARKKAGCKLDEKIVVQVPEWPEVYTDTIKQETMVSELKKGEPVKILATIN